MCGKELGEPGMSMQGCGERADHGGYIELQGLGQGWIFQLKEVCSGECWAFLAEEMLKE